MRGCYSLLLAAIALMYLIGAARGQDDADKAPDAAPPATIPLSVEQLAERIRRSVAAITSAGRDGRRDALGSGFVISADGLIATNFHVIGEGRSMEVQLSDGRTFEPAAIHAFDRQLDLAIVKIDADNLTPLELGDSDSVKQGQSVVALGNHQNWKKTH